MIYNFGRGLLRVLYKLLFRLEGHGLHHVPREGGVLLCSNHISNFDPPTIGILLKRKVHFMAKAELFNIPVLGWLFRELGAFPVKRGGVSKESIKTTLKLLRGGEIIGIFPEGTRSRTGEIGEGNKGAATFALRSDAVVIPVAIMGSYKLFRKMKVVYGPPVDLDEFRENPGTDAAELATARIMSEIVKLKSNNR
ncbi:1-acyl-sn-glycerol-3-phosphate acyltransferase [Paenibacillus sp. CAA11]|uniref:lysophospholipid acyltransferase family protein n=1 Tax=Paenibacillus sp. CAA11 TaxID=1532905 RepID=UPI000D33C6EE|nr:lysophospholipid acyltransferase family protein [Paenibacillus sp. CAA11]AWB45030.1 1-acyl-sn-glycerol-3-phosphate acyltransferase [Paenibacillus sp. CAA11]